MHAQLIQFIKFAVISALGLLLDLVIYIFLAKNNVSINYSSALGSSFAIVFVYFTSSIFLKNKKDADRAKFIIWIGFQIISILIFSNAVNYLYIQGLSDLWAKIVTIPVSFMFNYLFINLILNAKI